MLAAPGVVGRRPGGEDARTLSVQRPIPSAPRAGLTVTVEAAVGARVGVVSKAAPRKEVSLPQRRLVAAMAVSATVARDSAAV